MSSIVKSHIRRIVNLSSEADNKIKNVCTID